ncbi:Fanconi anemia group D2 protein-like isoform X2 [Dendronephthya gigantea]|uniref:Fanconi anemia group D2 protein-like isoform X2 n=1 Tax=Dendronephthya gigantea TaxID=151771 RepID=UPI00106C3633|nr:Fanconi anemia group D2 protein-like isoform X2 [Dendronephthya gigantea]
MLKSRKRISNSDKINPTSSNKKRKNGKENDVSRNDHNNKVLQSTFGKLVTKAGIILSIGEAPHKIKLDQTIFQRNLSNGLKRHQNYPQVLDEFIEGLTSYFEEPERFCVSLLPTSTSENVEESTRGPVQDSLMRIFLGVEMLQPLIANVLLEKIPEFSDDSSRVSEHDIPRLVINQFKWLDKISHPKDLSGKLLEIISISSVSIQREIITAIPEILDDNEHVEIARELIDIMKENSQLTLAILDTLTNLNLKTDLLSEVRESVINMLSSTEMDDLPVVVKFILQSVADNEAFEAITELRNNLEFSCSLIPSATSTPSHVRKSSDRRNSKDGVLLTLDAIKASIRFRKSIADGWLKTLDNVKNSSEHLVIDIFVALILYAVTSKRKLVESLLRNKIRSGCFTEDILGKAFKFFGQVLREYFENLLIISEVLLRSPDSIVSSYARAIYVQAFLSFDLYCKQEVVGALVTHVGSGFPNEADPSLDVLSDLVEHHPSHMSSFAIFLKGILDYLDNLSIGQTRKLFQMLSSLAFHNDDGSMIQDDLHMVIRKQLSSNSVKYKRIGIIGALMIVQSMAKPSSGEEETGLDSTSQSQPISMINEKQKQVVNLLDLVRNSITRVPEAVALFYDELANVIEKRQLDTKTEAWISETVVSDFQDDFLIDVETEFPESALPIDFVGALDDAEEGCIAFNLVSLLINHSDKSSQTVAPVCSAPHFRLLRVCEQNRNKGKLEGIDALLGCPVVMFKMEEILLTFNKQSIQDRELVCSSLFYCLNWYRELVNAFSTETDPEMKGKTLNRVKTIVILQDWLDQCLKDTPNFVPPLVHFDTEENAWKNSALPRTSAKRTRTGKNKHKENEHDKTIDEYMEKDTSSKDDVTVIEEKKEKRSSMSGIFHSSKYRACFRELDLNVFEILKCGLVSKAVLDSNMNTEKKEILQLQAPELYFLLDDLAKKLEYSLSSSVKAGFSKLHQDKQIGFSHLAQKTVEEIVVYVLELLPELCQHLETTSAFFQDLFEANDGVMDGPGSDTDEAKIMASCFERLFFCMAQFFSWSGFNNACNKSHLKKAFVILSSRTKISKKSQPGFQELASQAFRYFEQFSSTLPSITTAVTLVKLLTAVKSKIDNETNCLSVSSICGDLLKREWVQPDGQREQGSKFNENLQFLLKRHILQAKDPSAAIESITTCAIPELLDEKSVCTASTTMPTLTRPSFPAYYKTLLDCLVSCFKNSLSAPMKRSDSIEMKAERLVVINVTVRLFHVLVNLVKAFEHRNVLGAALKYGRLFVEAFVSLGMPALDDMLRTNKDDIHGLLKVFQQSTRSLQHFCGHSKVTKDISLTNHVPGLKKSLETFVFRVKAMLAVNQCHEAFWIGNLKNRDLRGQEIVSQQSIGDREEEPEETEIEDDDEDKQSNDDEESIVSVDRADQDEDDESCSESF